MTSSATGSADQPELSAHGLLKAALLVLVMTIAYYINLVILAGGNPFLAVDTQLDIAGEADINTASVLLDALITPCVLIFIIVN